jgi:formylglycine-generating enzyme required for sulfatase activity
MDIDDRLGLYAAKRLLPFMQQRLLKEGGLFLLDGLDEVPEAANRRQYLLESINALAASLPRQTRLLLTARPYAYADPHWQLQGFQLLALAPFRQEQVEQFIQHWHQAVRLALGWDVLTAQSRAKHLSQALLQRSYLADLASRPLLLTLMATLDSSWGQLPEDRADLYEESVKLLLSRWQQSREVHGPDGQTVQEPGIARALSLGESTIRSVLEKLAFQTHQRQGSDQARVDAPADIAYGEVLAVFTPLLPDDISPDVLLRYLEHRAGLLMGRREGIYAFPHRSFQEYLAACHLTNTEQEFAVKLRELVWQDIRWWREVFLLGVGKKRQGGLGDAINVINTLVPQEPTDIDNKQPQHWQTAVLAGEALLELRLPTKVAEQPHYQALQQRLRRWLRQLIETGQLVPRERLVAGDVLGRLGDPRPGVGVIIVKDTPAPDIDWVEIPAGAFLMGSRDDDDQAYEDEKPAHEIHLPTFRISRYPVTNAQYQPFIAAGGYEQSPWWTAEGWAWRQGAEADLSAIDDEDFRKRYADWLAQRPRERRNQPFWWDDPKWGAHTCPVVGVTWYEALAYCHWLKTHLRDIGKLSVGDRLRLPSEAEWEKAARGSQGYRWPWDNTWQENRANTKEAGLGETSPVGLFPSGASPYGIQDMAGNVWEWTRSRWGRTSIYRPDYRYPYDPTDGREEPSGFNLLVARGGSWLDGQGDARCASRGRDHPDNFDGDLGFRVVVSLANSEC